MDGLANNGIIQLTEAQLAIAIGSKEHKESYSSKQGRHVLYRAEDIVDCKLDISVNPVCTSIYVRKDNGKIVIEHVLETPEHIRGLIYIALDQVKECEEKEKSDQEVLEKYLYTGGKLRGLLIAQSAIVAIVPDDTVSGDFVARCRDISILDTCISNTLHELMKFEEEYDIKVSVKSKGDKDGS